MTLQEAPHLRRQVACLRDVPLVNRRAEFLDGTGEEGQFLLGQRCRCEGQQPPPVGPPREEVALPPDGACVQRGPLGLADPRQHRSHQPHGGAAQEPTPEYRNPRDRGHGGTDDRRDANAIGLGA